MLTNLNIAELNQRASDHLEAKMFFKLKKIQEYRLTLDGVISSKVCNDIVERQLKAAENQYDTLLHLFDLLETSY